MRRATDNPADTRLERQLEQLNAVLPAGLEADLSAPADVITTPSTAAQFAYLKKHVLVHRDVLGLALEVINGIPAEGDSRVEVTWPPEGTHGMGAIRPRRIFVGNRDLSRVIREIRTRLADSDPTVESDPAAAAFPKVSRVHIMSVTGGNLCSADEPAPTTRPLKPPLAGDDNAGSGVQVTICDTGLVYGYQQHSWLRTGVTGDVGAPNSHLDAAQTILPHAGHGTFVAGVLRSAAPGAEVYVSNAMRYIGAAAEEEAGHAIMEALGSGDWPPIICLAAGTLTENDAFLLGLSDFLIALRDHHADTVLIAAAGNDGVTTKFWPAAHAVEPGWEDAVVSVGALREDGQGRACFSNHGDWVRVYAQGERMVNAFVTGVYSYDYDYTNRCRFYDPPLYLGCTCIAPYFAHARVPFDTALAQWSGTSFAAPLVAAHIATYMSHHTGLKSRQAAAQLVSGSLPVADLSDLRV
ncbi:S8/S53 family peptidase [Streptosporangiaceae bacterium NEAU-GS5]|nr:S8/S53 family peptidase [Streptosporangiaceae bacterium NEAU-GS5]